MMHKVVIKPENSEPISIRKFDTKEDAISHIEGLRQSAESIFERTTANLLIVIRYAQVENEWVEIDRESLLR